MNKDTKKKVKCVTIAGMMGVTTPGLLTGLMDDIVVESPKKQFDINPVAYYTGTPYEILFEPHGHLLGLMTASASTTPGSYDKAAKLIRFNP